MAKIRVATYKNSGPLANSIVKLRSFTPKEQAWRAEVKVRRPASGGGMRLDEHTLNAKEPIQLEQMVRLCAQTIKETLKPGITSEVSIDFYIEQRKP